VCCAVPGVRVLCCSVLCCAVLCCAVLCCAVLSGATLLLDRASVGHSHSRGSHCQTRSKGHGLRRCHAVGGGCGPASPGGGQGLLCAPLCVHPLCSCLEHPNGACPHECFQQPMQLLPICCECPGVSAPRPRCLSQLKTHSCPSGLRAMCGVSVCNVANMLTLRVAAAPRL
jgi:hypothetical protein